MDFSSSPSAVQSAFPVMNTNVSDSFADCRFLATKKISVLLDDNNYLLWRQQVILALKTFRLQHLLDTATSPPPQQILDDSGVLQENPEFSRFEQQNCALASWLLSSVSTSVLPHLIGLESSSQIWNAIVDLFGSKTTSRLMSYRRALHSQRKADLPMKEYLLKIKSCCENLASCGEIISEREHVTAILNGLSSEYESVITVVTASQVPYTVQGVSTILLDTETRQQVIVNEVPSSANLVSS
ncbi:hypothetical protein Goarm_022521 [Gossypium armourianum]|uniref:Retrovirus-related Pol polyprotein from transposon TNT 1-94 n=1 Tax=Gossypium armourianum TaxID=34283 RepID=A0A7J9KDW4_9ROSI|nr:hypothetical protein [Gossypium armourianum]